MDKKQRQKGKVMSIIIVFIFIAVISFFLFPVIFSKINTDNPAGKACMQIASQQMKNNCLAIVNKDADLCNKTSEDSISACQAIVKNNPEICADVEPSIQKKIVFMKWPG